jgi:hypothetical protein
MGQSEPLTKDPTGREALNAAFWDLGLRFQWDDATWGTLAGMDGLREQLRYYLEHHQPHLLAVYDADALALAVAARVASPATTRLGMEAFARA